MKIHRSSRKYKYRIGAGLAAFVVALGLVLTHLPQAQAAQINKKYSFTKTNYAVPSRNVAWVAPDGNDASGNGTEGAPFATFKRAYGAVSDGGTVVAKSGVYREPHFFVSKNNITFQAAPGAEVWMKGSEVVKKSAWVKEGSLWKTTGNYSSFCHVCTVNSDPSKEGVAAYPEQAFINDNPLRQVARKDEVKPGTFYVEDHTPTTMRIENGKRVYTPGAHDPITYYLGSDPTTGTTEVSRHARAFTASGKGFAMKGINIAQYSPVQEWGFEDPGGVEQTGTSAVFIAGSNSLVQDSLFVQSSAIGLNLNTENTTVRNNKFINNGANGTGANRSHGSSYISNTFTNNNVAGFIIKGCGAYCTVSDIKVTHTRGLTFRDNIVDNSASSIEHSDGDNVAGNIGTAGFWCDEGCIDTKIVGNFFTNSGSAVFYEVSGPGIIASNIIESSGTGIRVSGSNGVKLYNNTISRTHRPIDLFEDNRADGCNAYEGTRCIAPEKWSQENNLSWNLTDLEMYNNIISSRAYKPNDSGKPYYSYPVRTDGDTNLGSKATKIYTNQMFKGFDNNVYYRSSQSNEPYMLTWDLEGQNTIDIAFKHAADISASHKINRAIDGRDAHSLDTFGSRANNPYFVKEAENNNDYKKSNYNLKPNSPARNMGKPLPSDVAQAIDPTGKTVKAGVPVNAGALVNALMDATNGQTPPPQPPATVSIPDAGLKAAINKTLGSSRPSTQEITADELSQITRLSIDSTTKVKNLAGLEKAVNLQELNIDNHEVTSLAPLSSLTKLTKLTATNNKITSIEPLKNLTNINTLLLSGNAITSTAPLADMTHLAQVSLSGKSAEFDVANFARSAASLARLQLSGSSDGKAQLKNSDKLKQLSKIDTLQLSSFSLTGADLNSIGAMTQLSSLKLDDGNISDVSFLRGLTNLTKLDVSNQQVRLSANTTPFASPLKDIAGSAVGIVNNANLANDGAGQIKVVAPNYDGAAHELSALWTKDIAVGTATAKFNGQLTASVTLPKAGKAQLQAQIDRANNAADYIKNDSSVASALSAARAVASKANSTPAEISQATNNLKQALDAAIAKEQAAQSAARAAVDKAKNSKAPADIRAAEALLANVQDAAKKSTMQGELNAIKQEISDARTALSNLITTAKNTPTEGLSSDTVNALKSEIAAAEATNKNQDSTVAQLVAAKTKLQAALNSLHTDKTPLNQAISDTESRPDYIKADAAVKAALQKAKNLQAAANPKAADIAAAITELRQAVAKAEQREKAAQAAATAAVVNAERKQSAPAITDAQNLVDKVQDSSVKAALQGRLNTVSKALAGAKKSLNELITTASKVKTDGMSTDTVNALKSAIADAKQKAADANVSVAELQSAQTNLQKAIDALRVDKTALNQAITNAEKEPSYIKDDSAVKAALQKAKDVQTAANPTPGEVNAAVNNLNAAVTAAKKKETDAQTAASAATAAAESARTAQAVAQAQNLVNAVRDASVKAALQSRLDAITNQLNNAKQALNTLIARAEATSTTGMSADTAKAFKDKITQAKQVYNDSSASVTRIQKATAELQAALDALRPDKTTLGDAIARAESQPAYIKADAAVKAALQKAKDVQAAANPTPAEISAATQQLNQAVAAAQKAESDAQAAATTAVATAESQKTAQAVANARMLVNKVQDPTVKASLRARLAAIVIQTLVSKQTVRQADGTDIVLSTSGDKCYNIKNAVAATQPQSKLSGYGLIGSTNFAVNCDGHAQSAVGYTAKITLELSRRYTPNKLKVIKYSTNGSNITDITSKVTFKTSTDGKRTIIEYSVTDGGFGDLDNTANGVIVDPVAVYESSSNAGSSANNNGSGVTASGRDGKPANATSRLSDTGESLYGYAIVAGILALSGAAGIAIYRRR